MILFVFFSLLSIVDLGSSIHCFECNSRNHSNPHCEDPMSSAYSSYEKNCLVPKEGHVGNFPANFCVKLYGRSVKTGEFMMIRRCSLEDMNSQCARFKFQNDTYEDGCILTCSQDGCNKGVLPQGSLYCLLPAITLTIFAKLSS